MIQLIQFKSYENIMAQSGMENSISEFSGIP